MSDRIPTPHYKANLPGGLVATYARSYGARVAYRNSRLIAARLEKNPAERAMLVAQAKSWHAMAMESLRNLRRYAEGEPRVFALASVTE